MTIAPTNQAIAATDQGPAYIRTADAAKYLGIGRSTLERYRISGKGPQYRVLGSKIVVYTLEDLDAFARRQVRTSTTKCAA